MMLTVGSTLLYVTWCWFETQDPAIPEEEKNVLNKLRELIEASSERG